MRQIEPGSLHVVIAGRLDGTVGFLYTRNPLDWLATLGSHFELGEIEVRASAAAEKIVRYLRSRFSVAHVPCERMPWYLIDYPQAVQALDEVDLETGEPASGLELGAKVQVDPGRRRGSVFGFTRGGRVVVKLEGLTYTENIVIAPRENVRLVVRVATISTGGEA